MIHEDMYQYYIDLCEKNKVEPLINLEQFTASFCETLAKSLNHKFFNDGYYGVAAPFCSKEEPELWLLIVPTIDKNGDKTLAYLLDCREVIDREVAKIKEKLDEKSEGIGITDTDGIEFFK